MFKAGGAGPFLRLPVRTMVDRDVDPGDLWGEAGRSVVREMRVDLPSLADRAAIADAFLLRRCPSLAPETADAVAAVEWIAADRELCRVEQLADHTGYSVRGLQRLFVEQVGLPPKKVIQRYRLLEAAESVAGGRSVSWAEVASRLGFSDQAHLTRDFKAAFGLPPAKYAALA